MSKKVGKKEHDSCDCEERIAKIQSFTTVTGDEARKFSSVLPKQNVTNDLILNSIREHLAYEDKYEKYTSTCAQNLHTRESESMPVPLHIIDTDYRYGFHVTKFPSMLKTVLRVTRETPLCAMQVYISSPKSKQPPSFDYTDLMASRREILKQDIYIVIHGCLLYNLAGTVKGSLDSNYNYALSSTLQGLIAELDYGVVINAGVIVHPGSRDSKCSKPSPGLQTISDSIKIALTRVTPESEKIAELLGVNVQDVLLRRKIILENAAGEGNKLCSTLEEIKIVIDGVPKKLRSQVKVCIDTAHAYGKGLWDWGKKGEIDRFYKEFAETVGLEYLELFHFNDSMKSDEKGKNAYFGSRKDRHQQLAFGHVFGSDDRVPQITEFMLKAKKHKVAIIGEPPESGMIDWVTVCGLLENTKYPLIEIR